MRVKHQLQGLRIIIDQFSRISFALSVLYFLYSYDAKTNHTKQNKNNVKLNDKTKPVFFDQIITISGVDEKYKANKFDCSQM